MNNEILVDILVEALKNNSKTPVDNTCKKNTFYKVGDKRIFRSVTMIYTGQIKEMRGDEILLEDCCWIAETKRWANSLADSDFKEQEPYKNDVVIHKGGLLDSTKIDKLPTEQKPIKSIS